MQIKDQAVRMTSNNNQKTLDSQVSASKSFLDILQVHSHESDVKEILDEIPKRSKRSVELLIELSKKSLYYNLQCGLGLPDYIRELGLRNDFPQYFENQEPEDQDEEPLSPLELPTKDEVLTLCTEVEKRYPNEAKTLRNVKALISANESKVSPQLVNIVYSSLYDFVSDHQSDQDLMKLLNYTANIMDGVIDKSGDLEVSEDTEKDKDSKNLKD